MTHTGKRLGLALGLTMLLAAGGCRSQALPWVELKGQRYQVELAMDEASRSQGLMFRDQLPQQQGMLFVFPVQAPQAFWMRNTRIPLDILYFDQALRLVSITPEAPPCHATRCPAYPSRGPARFVLELNAGHARQLGLKPGDRLTLAPELQAQIQPPPHHDASAP